MLECISRVIFLLPLFSFGAIQNDTIDRINLDEIIVKSAKIISNKMEYKNPYRKVKLNKERSNRKMMKSRIMGRPGKSSGGGSSSE